MTEIDRRPGVVKFYLHRFNFCGRRYPVVIPICLITHTSKEGTLQIPTHPAKMRFTLAALMARTSSFSPSPSLSTSSLILFSSVHPHPRANHAQRRRRQKRRRRQRPAIHNRRVRLQRRLQLRVLRRRLGQGRLQRRGSPVPEREERVRIPGSECAGDDCGGEGAGREAGF